MDWMELRKFRSVTGLTTEGVADALRTEFPRVDKPLISKCQNPLYGVTLSKDAEKLLYLRHPDAREKVRASTGRRKPERRKKTRRVSVRLADEEFSRLQQHLKDAGVTAQDALTRWIENEIDSKR